MGHFGNSPNSFAGILHCCALCEIDQSGFGGRVANVHLSDVPNASNGAENGDSPCPLFFHDGQNCFAAKKRRTEIDIQLPLPGL